MIVKVVEYFREGRWSFYPGETFHAEALEAERGVAMERVTYWVSTGHLEITEDGDPTPDPLAGDTFEDLMVRAGEQQGGVVEAEGSVVENAALEGLAEHPPSPTMTA
jgi:hypothetical protein